MIREEWVPKELLIFALEEFAKIGDRLADSEISRDEWKMLRRQIPICIALSYVKDFKRKKEKE